MQIFKTMIRNPYSTIFCNKEKMVPSWYISLKNFQPNNSGKLLKYNKCLTHDIQLDKTRPTLQ